METNNPDIRPVEHPPIAITPRWLMDQDRLRDIYQVCLRYLESSLPIPQEWIEERNEAEFRLNRHREQQQN